MGAAVQSTLGDDFMGALIVGLLFKPVKDWGLVRWSQQTEGLPKRATTKAHPSY